MEVLVISAWFLTIVVAATLFCGNLVARAMARDARYLVAMGELAPAQASAAEELPPVAFLENLDPVGTLAILIVYLMVLIGLWLAMFAILLQRS